MTRFLPLIRQQATLALAEASAAIFMVDGKEGQQHSRMLDRRVVATTTRASASCNKCESQNKVQFKPPSFGRWIG